ncbi:hypothetical protein EK904_002695 [Melospiza melodia maxima]|nr:hypothetical protein EK904_002695 [Melospiza melodia maxima]
MNLSWQHRVLSVIAVLSLLLAICRHQPRQIFADLSPDSDPGTMQGKHFASEYLQLTQQPPGTSATLGHCQCHCKGQGSGFPQSPGTEEEKRRKPEVELVMDRIHPTCQQLTITNSHNGWAWNSPSSSESDCASEVWDGPDESFKTVMKLNRKPQSDLRQLPVSRADQALSPQQCKPQEQFKTSISKASSEQQEFQFSRAILAQQTEWQPSTRHSASTALNQVLV